MNLISCEGCGSVFDKNNMKFPEINVYASPIDTNNAAWDGDDYVPFIECPVCTFPILESEGE